MSSMSVITTDDVRQVAWLARIDLSPEELQKLSAQLDTILSYVTQLQAVPTDSIEPTSHVLPLSNITRPDRHQPSPNPEDVLTLAPARHGNLVKVPKVVDVTQ